jgi:hypothetical protein
MFEHSVTAQCFRGFSGCLSVERRHVTNLRLFTKRGISTRRGQGADKLGVMPENKWGHSGGTTVFLCKTFIDLLELRAAEWVHAENFWRKNNTS